ncbi:MAG: hypothetical protein JRF50_12890 [Deltaproteobacteria bacterium]|nr:hypothetical protein [Deltaproteobacteria bacterium]
MSTIIEFPDEGESFWKTIESRLNSFDQLDPNFAKCIKENCKSIFLKHYKQHSRWKLTIDIPFPPELKEKYEERFVKQIKKALGEYTKKVQLSMLSDMFELQKEICRLQQRLLEIRK